MGSRSGYTRGGDEPEPQVQKAQLRTAAEVAHAAHAPPVHAPCKLRIAKLVLVGTGVWWGLCMQLIFYAGGGHPLAQLPNLDWYIGMMLVYVGRCCYGRDAKFANALQRHILPIAVCDFLGTVGTTIGLEMAGSAIFGIIFASVTVWSALFTYLLLSKPQTKLQIVGIAAVVCGLALPALEQSNPDDEQDELEVHIGILLTSVGTLFYAIEYVLCERIYLLYEQPVDAKQLCFYTGVWGLGFTAVWVALYTLPRWDELVTSEIALAGGSPAIILLLYFTHMLNNSAHNLSWFVVCELEGGVSTGLLMGLKAAALFFFSALFFCSNEHREQCLTGTKLLGTVIVLFGTAIYYGGCDTCVARLRQRTRSGRHRLHDEGDAELGAEMVGELARALEPSCVLEDADDVSAVRHGRGAIVDVHVTDREGQAGTSSAGARNGDDSSRLASLKKELVQLRAMLARERELRQAAEQLEQSESQARMVAEAAVQELRAQLRQGEPTEWQIDGAARASGGSRGDDVDERAGASTERPTAADEGGNAEPGAGMAEPRLLIDKG